MILCEISDANNLDLKQLWHRFNEKKGFGFIEPIDDAAGVLDKD